MATKPTQPTLPPNPVVTIGFGDVPPLIKASALTALLPLLLPGRVLRIEAADEAGAARLLLAMRPFMSRRGLPMLRFAVRGKAVICRYPEARG
ncbi:MAG: hypothetical protein ACLGP3_02270 [Acidobacteriota bacterium]